ncbi:MAG TPA: hypothetical protein VKY74_24020 [Chloroflexia bacterium]|nr:hypothetical protein [Chloroflexia bacterium]
MNALDPRRWTPQAKAKLGLVCFIVALAAPSLGCAGAPVISIPGPQDKNVGQHAQQGDYGVTTHPAASQP